MKYQKVPVVHLQMVKERELKYETKQMNTPENAVRLIHPILDGIDRETLVVCGLDSKGKPLYVQVAAVGKINVCGFSVPEVFKAALVSNAASFILFHNHPSGDTAPSREDIAVTKKLKSAGAFLDVPMEDHIIVGDNNRFYSFRESNEYWEEYRDEING